MGRTQIDLEPFQFLLKAESSYKIYIVIDNTKMHMSPWPRTALLGFENFEILMKISHQRAITASPNQVHNKIVRIFALLPGPAAYTVVSDWHASIAWLSPSTVSSGASLHLDSSCNSIRKYKNLATRSIYHLDILIRSQSTIWSDYIPKNTSMYQSRYPGNHARCCSFIMQIF